MSQSEEQSKHDAFKGLNKIVLCNPGDFLLNVAFYLEAVGLYRHPTAEVSEGIMLILSELVKGDEAVRKTVSEGYNNCSVKAREGLQTKYNFPPN